MASAQRSASICRPTPRPAKGSSPKTLSVALPAVAVLPLAVLLLAAVPLGARQLPPDPPAELPPPDRAVYADMTGQELYEASCITCHGADGTGSDPSFVAFSEPLPDFTDCQFARREPDADWVGVAHRGGPSRGFSQMMPAFGEVLDADQLQRVMDYVRSLCSDDAWPRGELNLPRALLTEKAFPEDEWVFETNTPLEGGQGAFMNTLVYEKRFGPRTMIEVLTPFGVQERTGADESGWVAGMGDLTLGVKHALYHSLDAGSILSLGAEVKLPTGKVEDGFGNGYTLWEGFLSWGQILPSSAFFQFQGIVEVPATSEANDETVLRGALGRTWTRGRWGRAWSPMIEVQAKRELVSGEAWSWDLVPQFQVTLNTRQHVMANVGILLPLTDADLRNTALYFYVLWDWFDGGLFEGW